ncbi:hypothetical protein ECHLIB_0124 [Ehrlichia chaffeensis str. Liberty]|nr:hypothetical protein ECHJAX_0124 [Ehrlichia chaffeensis str. Jax]AHX06205.1 hypothetical protein ECHLIB_0124 [Ehrlichia chaffeensis str. Liberty]AHX09860.1 hypothetical protein ECHWAK_0122 [Ehrlichia chaffeensis str. Wakulla]AHX10915.1 hypothetical protein ECHWP_0122 [Ehrlichia chaffeensis str. West Paces]
MTFSMIRFFSEVRLAAVFMCKCCISIYPSYVFIFYEKTDNGLLYKLIFRKSLLFI